MNQSYSHMTSYEKTFTPIEQKTFKNALAEFFTKEVPQIGGEMIVDLVVDKTQSLIDQYYPQTERLTMGQMLWFAIDENEKAGYGKSMTKTKIKPVILTVVDSADIAARKKGVSLNKLKDQIIARLYLNAKEQGAVLAESDVSLVTNLSLPVISKRTRNYENQFEVTLPRRGTIHDLGRSISHKRMICKKRKLERKSISQIANETDHTPQAITRYTKDLERVQFCLDNNLSINDISFVTKLSSSLTIEYLNIIDEIKQNQFEIDPDDELPF